MAAGAFAIYIELVLRWVDCGAEADSTCSQSSRYAVFAAVAGEILLIVMLFESSQSKGRPKLWLALALLAFFIAFVLS